MTTIIENPDPLDIKKWGPLAYVSAEKRNFILSQSAGQAARDIKRLEKQIAEMLKHKKAREKDTALRALHRKPVE